MTAGELDRLRIIRITLPYFNNPFLGKALPDSPSMPANKGKRARNLIFIQNKISFPSLFCHHHFLVELSLPLSLHSQTICPAIKLGLTLNLVS